MTRSPTLTILGAGLLIARILTTAVAKEICASRADGAKLTCPDGYKCVFENGKHDCVRKKSSSEESKCRKQKQAAADSLDYAALSDSVYGDKGAPPGWKRDACFKNLSGMNACTFKDSKNRTVLAFRGTTDVADASSDARQVLGDSPLGIITDPQYSQAYSIAKKVRESCGCEPILTGHSLGGGLAQYAAGRMGLEAWTFNAAGLSGKNWMVANMNASRVTNLRVKGDGLSIGSHVGNTITYKSQSKNKHKLSDFTKALKDIVSGDGSEDCSE